MDKETPNRRLTRGIENIPIINCGVSLFDLDISQLDSENVNFLAELKVDKSRAESRTKQKNDHVNNHSSMVHSQSRDNLIDKSKILVVDLSKKRKEKDFVSSNKEERVKCFKASQSKGGSNEVNHDDEDSIFVITDLPRKFPHMACYVEIKIFDTLKKKLPSVQFSRFMHTCFAQYASMPDSSIQSQMLRCTMSLELKTSSTDALMMRFNGYTLRFSLREFIIIFDLNCVTSKADFVFDTILPNRLRQKYFDSEEEPYKAILFQAFDDQVWGQDDDDSLKIFILYFIHRFIMSGKMNTVRFHRFQIYGKNISSYPDKK